MNADINFTYDETVPATESVTTALPFAIGLDGEGKVTLGSHPSIRISDTGILTTTTDNLTVPTLAETSLFETMQYVTTTGAETYVDLNIATIVHITQNQNTEIIVTELPETNPDTTRLFMVIHQHDDTSNAYSTTFSIGVPGALWYSQGGVRPTYTQTPGAIDITIGFIDSSPSVITNSPTLDYKQTAAAGQGSIRNNPGTARSYKSKNIPTDQVTGVESGMIITGMANQTLNACAAKVSPALDAFDGITNLIGCIANRRDMRAITLITDSDTISIDANFFSIISMKHNTDIATINYTPPTTGTAVTVLWRVKDATDTPRTMYFDPAIFTYDDELVLTQSSGAADLIVIRSIAGVNFVSVRNDYRWDI
jgi:hypothetical protein